MIRVHSYESMGTYDGPGLRLVVFLQGCPFKCLYCANPDTIPFEGGTMTDIEEIVRMAVSQKPFFGRRGGITFSGGEPTMQAKELLPLYARLKEEGIHICLDTNGGAWNSDIEELFRQTDLVMLCMRLSLVDALFREVKPFVILDDPFINLDDRRTAEALKLIRELSKDRQIIYLTCNSSRV